MSTEHSDQYPEVSGEDAGIVPPQGAPKQEWPKKIRTLTASELDRLTIDSSGRFYWDGQLVNYAVHQTQTRVEKPVDLDQHAMDLLERTARELDPNAAARSETTTATDVTATQETPAADAPALAATPADQLAPVTAEGPVAAPAPMMELQRHDILSPTRADSTRIVLSGWQSIGVFLLVVSFAIAALGMAASGFVAVHDWGCKSGTFKTGCAPAPVPPAPPPRPDIPA